MIREQSPSPRDLEERWAAHNYHPLPVTLAEGVGAWVKSDDGTPYLDLLSAYSALNFGHRHPRLVQAAHAQLDRITLTSRVVYNDQLGPFCAELASLVGMDAVLPMNTGAEAVETAIKAARKWAHEAKGVIPGKAQIITADGNFHGRTTTIVSFSTDPLARDGFEPHTPGFVVVPFGDLNAVADVITRDTAAVLVEPIQGEAGVILPPGGYLAGLRELCDREGVLLMLDEIQSGLGRTGTTLACDHEGIRPDVLLLGKALGGGIVPLSAVLARAEVMDVFAPGTHGSTFGGNPLACAVGREVVSMLATGEPQRQAARLGDVLANELAQLDCTTVTATRSVGLWAGVDLATGLPPARMVSEAMLRTRVLIKDTHGITLRIAPPLVIDEADLRWALAQLRATLSQLRDPGTANAHLVPSR